MVFSFFALDQKYSFSGKFGPKNQNFKFKQKFGTQINWNIYNSIAVFTFSVLDQKYPYLGKAGQKTEIVSLS